MAQRESEQTKIALIGKDINTIQKDIVEIKQSIRELGAVYAPQSAVDALREEVSELRKSADFWKWASPGAATIFSAIITFFVIEYFQKAH